jgi:NTE family protein
MTTAVVLSGAASLGAVQVGMLLALTEEDVRPDLIVGTSVGAVNGAWIAAHPDRESVASLAKLWRSLTRADVVPDATAHRTVGLLGRQSNLVPDSALRHLLEEHLRFRRLEDARYRFTSSQPFWRARTSSGRSSESGRSATQRH